MKRHIVVLQYAGDYAEAYWRIRGGGAENYAAQEYSLDAVASLVEPGTAVTSVCCLSPQVDDQVLPNGVRSVTLGFAGAVDQVRVARRVRELQPTHVLLRTPMVRVLRTARQLGSPVVSTFADSFLDRGIRAWIRQRRLARELNDANVLVVGNHGRNACLNLVRIGVRADKVVAWDWPHAASELAPKPYPDSDCWSLLYAGLLDTNKGVGDIVEAVAILRRMRIHVKVRCFGSGSVDQFRKLADDRGVGDAVVFCGQAPNATVCEAMRHSDVVLIPSRHRYPEGLPLTIYEALRSRTPIVGSDHPMFDGILVDNISAKVFPAGDAKALAMALHGLMKDRQLYQALSRNAEESWQRLQIRTKWGDLIGQWLTAKQPPMRDEEDDPAGVAALSTSD
jgi:glycosyltransferase involved in cell wall biosynthesis